MLTPFLMRRGRRHISGAVKAMIETERVVTMKSKDFSANRWAFDSSLALGNEMPVMKALPDTYETIKLENLSFKHLKLVRHIDPDSVNQMVPQSLLRILIYYAEDKPGQVAAQVVIKALKRFMNQTTEMTTEAYAIFTNCCCVIMLHAMSSNAVRTDTKNKLLSLTRQWVTQLVNRIVSDEKFVTTLTASSCSSFLIAQVAARVSSERARQVLFQRFFVQEVLSTSTVFSVSGLLFYQNLAGDVPEQVLTDIMNSHTNWLDADINNAVEELLWSGIQLQYDFPVDLQNRLLFLFKKALSSKGFLRNSPLGRVVRFLSRASQVAFHYNINDEEFIKELSTAVRIYGSRVNVAVIFVSLAHISPTNEIRSLLPFVDMYSLSAEDAVHVLHAAALCDIVDDNNLKIVIKHMEDLYYSCRMLCRIFLSLSMMHSNDVVIPDTVDYTKFHNRHAEDKQEYYQEEKIIETCLERVQSLIAKQLNGDVSINEAYLFDIAEGCELSPEVLTDELKETLIEHNGKLTDKEAFHMIRILRTVPEGDVDQIIISLADIATKASSTLPPEKIITCWKYCTQTNIRLSSTKLIQLIKLIRPAVAALSTSLCVNLLTYLSISVKSFPSSDPVVANARNIGTFVRQFLSKKSDISDITHQQKSSISLSLGVLGLESSKIFK